MTEDLHTDVVVQALENTAARLSITGSPSSSEPSKKQQALPTAQQVSQLKMNASELQKKARPRVGKQKKEKSIRLKHANALQKECKSLQIEKERQKYQTWVERNPRPTCSEEAIGRQIRIHWESTRSRSTQGRQSIIADVEQALSARWPGFGLKVVPFGSTLTGLSEATSDLDLCIVDPYRPLGAGTPEGEVIPFPEGLQTGQFQEKDCNVTLPDYYSVRSVARSLERYGGGKFAKVFPVRGAQVPIVKFIHKTTGLACDLNINDMFGLHNSKMIAAYCDLAPEIVRPLLFIVKKWASRRQLNDPSGENGFPSLNSYTICLIVLQFLQAEGIVPNLQAPSLLRQLQTKETALWRKRISKSKAVSHVVETDVMVARVYVDPHSNASKYDTTFATLSNASDREIAAKIARTGLKKNLEAENTSNKRSVKDQRLGYLFTRFFSWLSEIDPVKCGFSLRMGCLFNRQKDKNEVYPTLPSLNPRWPNEPLLCQDPFIIDRNTSGAIDITVCCLIQEECRRASAVLSSHSGSHGSVTIKDPLLTDVFYDLRTGGTSISSGQP